jgi:LDH2 family malate/lactate/ureidoglycolate dehydrogenase
MPRFDHNELKEFSKKIFLEAGTSEEEADIVSNMLVRANLFGVDSHGVIRIPDYVQRIEDGRYKVKANPRIVKETETTALLDGDGGFGQVAALKGMQLAIKKANKNNVAVVLVFNCGHAGRIAEYSELAAKQDMIGIVYCKAYRPCTAPWGGAEKILGTNPISYGIPTGKGFVIVADFATSVAAEGKLRVKVARGESIPKGWVIDKDGNDTTNPNDFYEGGALLPFGNHKGYAISLMAEILGGALSGAGVSWEFKGTNALFMQAVNIDSFIPIDEFKMWVDRLVDAIKSSKRARGFDEILLPGEPERREYERKIKEGIFIEESTWKKILKTASKLGVKPIEPLP